MSKTIFDTTPVLEMHVYFARLREKMLAISDGVSAGCMRMQMLYGYV
jgi:hypothetical protein